MYMNANRTEDAEKSFRSTLTKYHSPADLSSIQCLLNLVQILSGSGREAEGIAMFREAIRVAERKLGPRHTATLRLLQNLGNYITDPIEALEVSQRAYLGTLQRYGKDNPDVLTARNSVTANLVMQKRWTDAVPLLEESESQFGRMIEANLAMHRNFQNMADELSKQVRSVQINAYLQEERHEDAERLTRMMLRPDYAGPDFLKPQTARLILVMSLFRQNRQDEATEVLTELQRMPEFQELSPTALAVLQGLQGEIAFAAGDYEKAIELLNGSWEKLSSAEPMEIYSQVPRYLAIALTNAYEMNQDETSRTLWLDRAKSLGYEEK